MSSVVRCTNVLLCTDVLMYWCLLVFTGAYLCSLGDYFAFTCCAYLCLLVFIACLVVLIGAY